MKTERRQELRTNELSQQLEEIGEYAKRNAVPLTVAVIAAAVLVGGGFTYAKWQHDRRMEAWDTIDNPAAATDPARVISDCEAVAKENLTPELTVAALLRVAATSMHQILLPDTGKKEGGDVALPAETTEYTEKAQRVYTEIVDRFATDVTAAGQAMIGLGVLAEDRGDMEQARSWYQKVIDDSRYADTPFHKEANYRLSGLQRWSAPVNFPPPQMTVPIPEGMEEEAHRLPTSAPASQPSTAPANAPRPSADLGGSAPTTEEHGPQGSPQR
jgi:hypothetical protein